MIPDHKSKFKNYHKPLFFKNWGVAIVIFLLAMGVRVPQLDGFLTIDEPIWVEGSRQFLSGLLFTDYECPPMRYGRPFVGNGRGCTFYTGHPGVTTMWGGSLGLLIYYWQAVRPTGVNLYTFLQTLPTEPLNPALIAPTRLPLAIATALFPAFFYILLRRLFTQRVALVATLMLTLSPFHIALSRVLHHDALATTFMVLSLLAMVGYWLQGWRWYWLPISAALAGLAFLSKAVGWFMMPYAAVIGVLALFYRWQSGQWRGWFDVWSVVGEGIAWGVIAWLTFALFFPGMWVIPRETIAGVFNMNFQLGQEGHEHGHYILGRVALDPGPIFYPVGWLLRASPLEVMGLLILPAIVWQFSRSPSSLAALSQQLMKRRTLVALVLFIGLLLIVETVSSKKMVRYFLPAFPIIDVFVAIGLLWLLDNLIRLNRNWALPLLVGIILLIQGWFITNHFPYYFTYYNPLLGGTSGAARLITVGWGEGIEEAAAYLNQQANAESLRIETWYSRVFDSFFTGQSRSFSDQTGEVMEADYLVYYRNQVQRQLLDMDVWRYFEQHHTPVHRVTLHGLDYVLIYRNPIQHHINWRENRQSNVFTMFGYNLATDGRLILFWQNLNDGKPQALRVGLQRVTGGEILWVACEVNSTFAAEANVRGAIMESLCPLATANPPATFYNLQLGLGNGSAISPLKFPAGRLALSVDTAGRFSATDPTVALELLANRLLPPSTSPLDISVGNIARLVGYRFDPAIWRPGSTGTLSLYWQPIHEVDLSIINNLQLVLRLFPDNSSEPVLTMTQPILPQFLDTSQLVPGFVIPARYLISLPEPLTPGQYSLDVCLSMVTTGQPVMGTSSNTSDLIECIPLSVTVNDH